MCTEVVADRARLTTQYEFAKWLGIHVRQLPLENGYSDESLLGRACLCPVDIDEALIKAGKNYSRDRTGAYFVK